MRKRGQDTGHPTYHDGSKEVSGKNLVFVVEADDPGVAHAGDLGHTSDAAA